MRWITFLMLLYVFAALHHARFGALRPAPIHDPLIQYLPLLGVFYALYADEAQAALVGLWCGLLFDILSAGPLGINTCALGLVCFGVVRVRMSIFREHVVSQIVVVFLAVLAFGILAAGLRMELEWLMPRDPGAAGAGPFWTYVGEQTVNGLYTAVVAPLIFWLLFRLSPLLGFSGGRRRG